MTALRAVHYLNQFFAGIGAEARADMPPDSRTGPTGPGRLLQQVLGDRGEIVATIYCGDNYAGETSGAIDEILDLIAAHRPQIVIAGPAIAHRRRGAPDLAGRPLQQERLQLVEGERPVAETS